MRNERDTKSFDLEKAVELIKKNRHFQKMKGIIENNVGHDHEPAYDHSVTTYEVAKDLVQGSFITNPDAKEKFEAFMDQTIDGITKRELLQVVALIHDIGKLIVFDDRGKSRSLNITYPDGTTLSPEHGYWGSLIVGDITKEVGFSKEITEYMAKILRLHVASWNAWSKEGISAEELLWETKLINENAHVDVAFNMYADFKNIKFFKSNEHAAIEIFNMPEFYNPVDFSIMD